MQELLSSPIKMPSTLSKAVIEKYNPRPVSQAISARNKKIIMWVLIVLVLLVVFCLLYKYFKHSATASKFYYF